MKHIKFQSGVWIPSKYKPVPKMTSAPFITMQRPKVWTAGTYDAKKDVFVDAAFGTEFPRSKTLFYFRFPKVPKMPK